MRKLPRRIVASTQYLAAIALMFAFGYAASEYAVHTQISQINDRANRIMAGTTQ
ncbi:MAG: hypothetical protein RLZZ234_878 [Candidatus Parcubacteria bacterium]|jgi:hypothetical protein